MLSKVSRPELPFLESWDSQERERERIPTGQCRGRGPTRAHGPTPWTGTSGCPPLLRTTSGYSFWEAVGKAVAHDSCIETPNL